MLDIYVIGRELKTGNDPLFYWDFKKGALICQNCSRQVLLMEWN